MAGERRRPRLPAVELRPQSVLFTVFGDYAADDGVVLGAARLVDLLEGAGVGATASRAALNRMTKRGLLQRAASGRQAYFGLTDFGRRTLLDGRDRALVADVVDRGWDGSWTLVSFSLGDDAQRERHELRSRLIWAGFGMVQAGLWAAPREVDVAALLSDLDVGQGVNAFTARSVAPTDAPGLVRAAYDLDALAAQYDGFVARWRPLADRIDEVDDAVLARAVLGTDWLLALRDDPRLPVQFLDATWPGITARDLHHDLESHLRPRAEAAVAERLDQRRLRRDGTVQA